MKSVNQVIQSAIVAFALIFFASQASAGVGPEYIFAPVKVKDADSLKPGSTILISCGNCGQMHTAKVDEKRTYLHSVTCPSCQTKYVATAGGRNGGMTRFIYSDNSNHEARLYSKTN